MSLWDDLYDDDGDDGIDVFEIKPIKANDVILKNENILKSSKLFENLYDDEDDNKNDFFEIKPKKIINNKNTLMNDVITSSKSFESLYDYDEDEDNDILKIKQKIKIINSVEKKTKNVITTKSFEDLYDDDDDDNDDVFEFKLTQKTINNNNNNNNLIKLSKKNSQDNLYDYDEDSDYKELYLLENKKKVELEKILNNTIEELNQLKLKLSNIIKLNPSLIFYEENKEKENEKEEKKDEIWGKLALEEKERKLKSRQLKQKNRLMKTRTVDKKPSHNKVNKRRNSKCEGNKEENKATDFIDNDKIKNINFINNNNNNSNSKDDSSSDSGWDNSDVENDDEIRKEGKIQKDEVIISKVEIINKNISIENEIDRSIFYWINVRKTIDRLLLSVGDVYHGPLPDIDDLYINNSNLLSSPSDIRKLYLKIVRYCHPDKQDTHANDRIKLEAMKVFTALSDAYTIYKNSMS